MHESALQSALGYQFKNQDILTQALTHRSFSTVNNERLEFLGDAILNCVVAHTLFQHFPNADEGSLSRARAHLVKQQTLYEVALKTKVPPCLLLGEGERKSGGFKRPSMLADVFEALLAAIFLDSNWETTAQVIETLFTSLIANLDIKDFHKDAKTSLQELLQGNKIDIPIYHLVEKHGKTHIQQFEVECRIPSLNIRATGIGPSRRSAEQESAKGALQQTHKKGVKLPYNRKKKSKSQLPLLGITTSQSH